MMGRGVSAKLLMKRSLSPYLALGLACFGVFIAALDQTVVVTALADMMNDERVNIPITELDRASWIIAGYLLGYTVAMPLMGRMADSLGHVRIYALATFVFVAGSVLVALSVNLGQLVGARILQAVGGGAMVPITMAIAANLFPSHRRAIPLGLVGGVAEAGGVLGPAWGALVLHFLDWRWIFWLNIPLALVAVALLWALRLPRGERAPKVDYLGGLLLAGALASLTLAISGEIPASSALPPSIALYILAALFTGLFFVRQRWAKYPLLPLALFTRAAFSYANIAHLLLGGALIIAMVDIPLMADTVMGQSPEVGGLRLIRLTAALAVGAVVGGILAQRLGISVTAALGFLLSALGFLLMSRWSLGVSEPFLTIHLMTAGAGFGLVIAPLATSVINSVSEDSKASAAALFAVMRMVGMMMGLAAVSTWGTARFDTLTAGIPSPFLMVDVEGSEYSLQVVGAAMKVFKEFFLISMAICLLALLPSVGLSLGRAHSKVQGNRGPKKSS